MFLKTNVIKENVSGLAPPPIVLNQHVNIHDPASNKTSFKMVNDGQNSDILLEPVQPDRGNYFFVLVPFIKPVQYILVPIPNESESKNERRHYNKKDWKVIDIKIELTQGEWDEIVTDGRFIKGGTTAFFQKKLKKFHFACVYISCNTWTMQFKCKKCPRELKFSARVQKQFQLFTLGTANCLFQ